MTNNICGLPVDFVSGATEIIGDENAKNLAQMIFSMAKNKDDFGRTIGVTGAISELNNELKAFIAQNPELFKNV